jgi:hypothetical protein
MMDKLEWSSIRRGMGYGPMGSGGDGPPVRACPLCGGIDPSAPNKDEFREDAHGHQSGCRLATFLDDVRGCDDAE